MRYPKWDRITVREETQFHYLGTPGSVRPGRAGGRAGLYGAANRAGSSRPVLLGVALVLALLWELGFSGPALNPGDATSAMPHRARVIAYSGYLILTTAAVLQLGTLRSSTRAPVGIFESETLVQAGMIEFGVPLAITIFLVRWLSAPTDNDRALRTPHTRHAHRQ
jgi:hypothetical protein